MALGYRRGQRGGTWLVRIRDPHHAIYQEMKLGRADDEGCPSDGAVTLTYDQALKEARKAQAHADAKRVSGVLPGAGKLTVNDILDEYEKGYLSGEARRGERQGRDIRNVRSILNRHVRPALGDIPLDRLNADILKRFKADVANGPKLTRNGQPAKIKEDVENGPQDDKDKIRKRRARANRILTPLRAALNYALSNNCIASDAAWRVSLKAYADVEAPTIRYLTLEECERLQKAAEPDFAELIKAALLTGCRYGSLRFMKVGDVDLKARTAIVRITKNGKPQIIRLTHTGCAFLKSIMKKKKARDWLFTKSTGDPWKPSDQTRRMKQAFQVADIIPEMGFHGLRDTFASHLVMSGVPLLTVSRLLGHADTRTTEKYYAHLAPDHLHKVLDEHLPDFF
ncbi:site-specific integrase [Methylovirgula sp. HY1]|uniref:tyrosine-type recombinase/integrase n=1 Tax=Methylovirgula sp. HY1 TaxID=2822761 RepID=UPI001C5B5952|nr:site-specific integrase [Methylovirgula sp. HY1]